MVQIALVCVIVGEAGNVFDVEIDDALAVWQLKDVIWEKIKEKFINNERFKGVVAMDLQLFLAKKDGAWMGGAGMETVTLDEHGHPQGFVQMDPLLWIKNVKYFGDNFQPSEGEIHVLVVVPQPQTGLLLPYSQVGDLVVGDIKLSITPTMILNPPALVAFWEALVNDRTKVEADALIELPRGTYLLGTPSLGSRIYIRHCYPELWKRSQQMIHDVVTKTPHLVILGNPGIGKTFFGFVILLLLARDGATVVYESGMLEKRILFSRDAVGQGSHQDFDRILDQPTTYYIVDAVKPAYYEAKTLLLTSPRRSIWYEFNKTNCRSCYMPVWSMKEILTCRELMYSDTPEAAVLDCFRRCGGIARYVLRLAQVGDQQVLLEKALETVNMSWLVHACGKPDADDAQVSHRLLHYRVNKHFFNEYFVFASQYVQEAVYKRLYEKDKRKLLEFIGVSDGIGALAVLRGHLFEEHVHSVLPRGGAFRVRRLVDNNRANDAKDAPMGDECDGKDEDAGMDVDDEGGMEVSTAAALVDDGVSTISFPRSEKIVFNDGSEVVAAANAIYLQPAMKNYQSVDAIMKPNLLFQVTGAHKHPCKQKGLHDVLKLLGDPAASQLYFVLPPDRFANFPYQKYLDSKRKRMAMSSYMNVRTIQQFAMEVKLVSE